MLFSAGFYLIYLVNTVRQFVQIFSGDKNIIIIRSFDRSCKFFAFQIIRTLINKYGSIYAVLKAPPEELKLVKGIGDSSATFLNIVGSLVTLIMDRVMNNSPDFNERLNSFFTTAPEGDFILLFSDPSLGVVGSHRERVSHVINGSIAIRELLTDFLLTDARTVILGISHGPYLPLPTDEDYQLIECIREPLRYIEADIADVIIYGGGKTFSMHDRMPFSLK